MARQGWFLLAEESRSLTFFDDSPRGFELRFASDKGSASIGLRLVGAGSVEEASRVTVRVFVRERGKIAVKLLRAHGGCLGVRRRGVEVCDMLGGADKQASIDPARSRPDNPHSRKERQGLQIGLARIMQSRRLIFLKRYARTSTKTEDPVDQKSKRKPRTSADPETRKALAPNPAGRR